MTQFPMEIAEALHEYPQLMFSFRIMKIIRHVNLGWTSGF